MGTTLGQGHFLPVKERKNTFKIHKLQNDAYILFQTTGKVTGLNLQTIRHLRYSSRVISTEAFAVSGYHSLCGHVCNKGFIPRLMANTQHRW